MVHHPTSKFRMPGQRVKFCCEASAFPGGQLYLVRILFTYKILHMITYGNVRFVNGVLSFPCYMLVKRFETKAVGSTKT